MQVVDELSLFRPGRGTLITIGVFDGVHRGHQHLIGETVRRAHERGLLSGVITFPQNPRTVLQPGFVLPMLTLFPERVKLIEALGVDVVVPITFTRELSQLAAAQFVGLLREHFLMEGLVVGPDFALGRGREGNVDALKALGEEQGFTVDVIELVNTADDRISSTMIREAVAAGDVARVGKLLGRPYSVEGTVIHGDARGRTLGFPTANIEPALGKALPADGIYATWASFGEGHYAAATYIGTRPTFDGSERLLEVFLLDFDRDIYGRDMTITLVDRVRGDQRFENAEELAHQMNLDVIKTRQILGI